MNKKVLMGLGALIVVGAGTAASFALFSDVETSGSNTFAAGTLDMSVGGANGTAFESFNIENIGGTGGYSGGKTWTITNSGSVPGNLTFQMNDLVNNDNGCNEPEALVDTSCGNPGPGDGELGAAISTTVLVNGNTTPVVSSNLASEPAYKTQWDANAGTVTIPAGGTATVTMNWSTDPTSYGNEIQSDGVSFQLQYDLTQVVPTN
ncbi:MAG: hypothetical protein COU65_03205 [Candidatus Pacebacteria bacterium CG10_big_fil_rev_8_21_14_0_10_42_12]|nr:MAG: hypothetical protein COU65_03205 [Candidatus Pacebacteria bacterium CG10_big_fil_rev_8_21_14_0_10_42_12]